MSRQEDQLEDIISWLGWIAAFAFSAAIACWAIVFENC